MGTADEFIFFPVKAAVEDDYCNAVQGPRFDIRIW